MDSKALRKLKSEFFKDIGKTLTNQTRLLLLNDQFGIKIASHRHHYELLNLLIYTVRGLD